MEPHVMAGQLLHKSECLKTVNISGLANALWVNLTSAAPFKALLSFMDFDPRSTGLSDKLTGLPDELLAYIIGGMPLRTLFSLRNISKRFYRFLDDVTVWQKALSSTLGIPRSSVETILLGSSPGEVRQRAMRVLLVNEQWHRPQRYPRRIRTYRWLNLRDVQILPGGDWLVCLSTDGTLQLRRADRALSTEFTIPEAVDMSGFTTSSTSVNPHGSFYVLFHCTQRLYIYEVYVVPEPIMRLVVVTVRRDLGPEATILRNASIAGNIVGFDCFWAGRNLLCLRTVRPNSDGKHEQIAFLYNMANCTIHILSRRIVIVCDASSIEVHKVPELRPMSSVTDLQIVESEIILKQNLQIVTPGTLTGSPAVWDSFDGGHIGPLIMIGPGVLHIVLPSSDLESYGFRAFRVPEILAPFPTSGTRYALCPQLEPGRGLVFWTVKYPVVLPFGGDDDPRSFEVEPDYVPVGRFVVDEIKHMAVVATRMDDWTGRACIILEDGPNSRSLGVLDVV
ncbi:hypothetical protein GLOTRDRAFT_92521 [Gloeophyllum trabeum ATCC 11539]|uniref:F-box domain-containing protein n=1 Tax=Gloeophyllum trabeum (strain ATCC 11539 / FP-39264 / Madison 617) TaxID=670483 RepID=S7QDS9_GLOTA|nr:uncharacterized protein GLOTRDRAFT_92521 [Gloeophyllum trabeum ATCC 11539]EPQ57507.1 hypothetical protein GLOTRDRAFT_92521 [Gloeophyllum trabeum ATCC 11539]